MFGFGKGKVEIRLDKFNFSPGETVEGSVTLQLKEPIKTKELSIRFYGLQRSQTVRAKGGSRTDTRIVHDFKLILDEEKEYPRSDLPIVYPFKIKIPDNLLQTGKQAEGVLGGVMEAFKYISGFRASIYWYLEARLNVPWAFDIIKKIQISIG